MEQHRSSGVRPRHRLYGKVFRGRHATMVDSIDCYQEEITRCNRKLAALQVNQHVGGAPMEHLARLKVKSACRALGELGTDDHAPVPVGGVPFLYLMVGAGGSVDGGGPGTSCGGDHGLDPSGGRLQDGA